MVLKYLMKSWTAGREILLSAMPMPESGKELG